MLARAAPLGPHARGAAPCELAQPVAHRPADDDAADGGGKVRDDQQGVHTPTLATSLDSLRLSSSPRCQDDERAVAIQPRFVLCGSGLRHPNSSDSLRPGPAVSFTKTAFGKADASENRVPVDSDWAVSDASTRCVSSVCPCRRRHPERAQYSAKSPFGASSCSRGNDPRVVWGTSNDPVGASRVWITGS
jgi:hypothetical protein